MDADVDGEVVFAGGGLEALDEGAAARGLDRGDGFGGVGRDVIGCFGEEEGLGVKALGLSQDWSTLVWILVFRKGGLDWE